MNLRLTLTIALATTLLSGVSFAEDRATAQQLFREGKQLMTEGKPQEACPKFEGAAHLSPTPGVRLNLGDCLAALGRTASAWARYEEALSMAERGGDQEAADLARSRRESLLPRLSYLIVSIPAAVVVPGLEVLRDGQELPDAAWNSPLPVDPGEHEIVVRAPGYRSWSLKKPVSGEGTTTTVEVVPLQRGALTSPVGPSGASTGATRPVDRPRAPNPGQAGVQRTVAFVVGGIGIVGMGIATYLGLETKAKKDDYEKHRAPDGRCLDQQCQTLSSDAYQYGNASTGAFVASGVLVVTGMALWISAPSTQGSSKASIVVPYAGTQGGGVAWRGVF